ncbi:hypothetical protein [uncultured Aquincola sp.]|uniref:hypothetical protein n=1 Tax=uncultured Aquincola sp. TaxID=886556 RepID=UPI0032B1B9EC|tara:strand:- start:650 stop:853 length:204 start_codon:yes stop_codon:yes gene_type:complete
MATHRRAQGQLVVAAVTHDLRSPLLAATLSTMLLRRMVEQPHAVAAIDRLERSHRRMDARPAAGAAA